jgi:thiol-disulfide isomerase/thioredoxin
MRLGNFGMQRFLISLFLSGLGLVIASCSAVTLQSASSPIIVPTLGPTPTPLRAPRNIYIPTEFDLLYYATDLNLVGVTGRPQFINAYADWCRECQRNRPTVHSLQERYGDRVDFLHVDVENRGALDAVRHLGVTGQTQYVLTDNAGNVIYRWFGILDELNLETALADLLNER